MIGCCTRERGAPPPEPAATLEGNDGEDPLAQRRVEAGEPPSTRDTAAATPLESDRTPPEEERKALYASARGVVAEFVDALSNGDASAARAKLISKTDFEDLVAPGFRDILGGGVLAKNEEELLNLVDAVKGHEIDGWEWKPGKLVRTRPESAFTRSLLQITDGRIELEVEGAFLVVGIDQLVLLESGWAIFQMHNL